MAENESGCKLLFLRSDNGGEFTSLATKRHLAKEGVVQQTIPPYSLESNGMAERLNRTLQDKCKTMMIAAKVPRYLWGEVFEAANTLRNVTPISNMTCTPIEKWTGQKPDLSKLRIIGSKAFCQIQKSQRGGKFEPVAYMEAVVNYNNSSNAYRV